MRSYLLMMVVAAVVTYLTAPAVRGFAFKVRAMTPVRDRDVHDTPTPRLGGVAMMLGVLAAFVVAGQTDFLHAVAWSTPTLAVVGAGLFMCCVGALDDIFGLDAPTRLAAQALAGMVIAWQGVQLISLPVLGVTVGSGGMFLFLTVFIVVATVNAVNFIDGLDGLLAGVMGIAGSAYFMYTYALTRESSPSNYSSLAALIMAATVGVCLGFLPHNMRPARIFSGDSGSYLLGLLMAASAIAVTGQIDPAIVSRAKLMPAFAPLLMPIAILLIPFVDLVWAVVRRIHAGKHPFSPDRGHLHHRLLDLGHSHGRAVWAMYIWAAVLSYGSVALAFLSPVVAWTAISISVALAIGFTVSPKVVSKVQARQSRAS